MNPEYVINPLGDSAIIVTWEQRIDPAVHAEVMKTYYHLRSLTSPYITDLIPAYASLTIVFNTAQLRYSGHKPAMQWMMAWVREQVKHPENRDIPAPRELHIPACYDPSLAPDITEMAASRQVAINDIIAWHTQTVYTVYLTGFLPGFPYMGKVCAALETPRRKQPRLQVPAGSIGIAGAQTGIYPITSPGGWNIIGQTPLRMFSTTAEEPCYCRPGDKVRFIPVTLEVFRQIQQEQ
ncbi:5-oxoprolinase subunit PxpB [Chitinophaga solisilvae]|uniref:5-oxoprolinase subunit PxpB n=1 Tax=Chitinophaga solisilvae TaxID=1233460 RepID=UPI00136DBCF5|nr:5-oxoprolinase subunit PxpB [Chitinophaga solisilvae]